MGRQSSFWKSFGLIMGMLAVLVTSWEWAKADPVLAQAVVVGGGAGAIPEQSIRLRILADSDSPADQALKLRVRDAVVASMNDWASEPRTLDEARAYIRERLNALQEMAAREVRVAGYDYEVKAELGLVPFPTKVYDGRLYPAGEYEALRITIGRGLGQNWWCVLFPPLCFVDIAAAEKPRAAGEVKIAEAGATAVVAAGAVAAADEEAGETGADVGGMKPKADESIAEMAGADENEVDGTHEAADAPRSVPEVEYRFFLAEFVTDVIDTVRGWFAHLV